MVRFLASGTGCGDDAVSEVATKAEAMQTPLCARQPRVSNFRVCHTTAENRNSKKVRREKAGSETSGFLRLRILAPLRTGLTSVAAAALALADAFRVAETLLVA
jgi:hypothetical protein